MVTRAAAPRVRETFLTAGAATMPEPTIDEVKKSLNPIIDEWSRKFSPISKKLEELLAQLKELEKNKAPSEEDKKKKLQLTLTRDQMCKVLKDCTDTFNKDILKVKIPEKAPPDLLKKLPDIVREGIKRKGIPAGKNFTIVPKPDVDLKNFKFKGGTLDLRWDF
jgi:hypothetical protein